MRALLLLGVSAIAVNVSSDASAQENQLPPLTVEGNQAKKPAKKKAAAKKAAPATVATQPPQQQQFNASATANESTIQASEIPYTVPAGVSVVGVGEIDTFGQTRLDNVLRAQAGTFTRESAGNPGIAVNIRGFEGMGRVNTMIDGVRQNFRFLGHEAGGFTYVDPMLLAGIDIQRGAISTAGGAGALAGAANFRTLGVSDIIKDGQDSGVLTAVSWGSNGVGWSEMLAAGMRTESVGVAAAIAKTNQNNYKNGSGQTVPFTDQDIVSGLVKGYGYFSPEARLDVGGVFYDNDFSANSYYQNLRSSIVTSRFRYAPSDNQLVNLNMGVQYSNVEMTYLRGLNSFARDVGRKIEDKGAGFDISNTSRFSLGGVRVSSTYGVEYFVDDFRVTKGAVNPAGQNSVGGVFSETTFSQSIFDLIVGLRYDFYGVEGSGSVLAAGGPIPIGPYTVDKTDGRIDPKITLAAKPLDWLQVYGTYSETMRPPTVTEMLVGGDHPGGGSANYIANPFLNAEVSKGFEIGANILQERIFTANDRFGFKAAYFDMDIENYIVTCLGPVYFFCNAPGTSKVSGVELQGNYDAGFLFAGMTYTYLNSKLPAQTPGFGASQFMPDHNLVLTGGLRFLDQDLEVGARGYFVSSAEDPSAASGRRPGYDLMDLFANYRFSESITFGGTVTNVFDATYTPVLGTAPSSSCVPFPPTVCPPTPESGRGRTFLLTTRAQF
ncbi:TonB-dependent receptor domain-containing protein [Hyphomicrobium sulfonivorans]|uniref:TonB-dependent receptor domain-containing protein n=1 Tax=Hyphomicrobium sulfonivorans TaxID=121290 RepID=UPI0018DE9C94|nr:TonB-dependent receptor [Hyphomicrobium sulfonivorans]